MSWHDGGTGENERKVEVQNARHACASHPKMVPDECDGLRGTLFAVSHSPLFITATPKTVKLIEGNVRNLEGLKRSLHGLSGENCLMPSPFRF